MANPIQIICPACFRVSENPRNLRHLRKRRRGIVEMETRGECEHCGTSFRHRSIATSEISKIYNAVPLDRRAKILGIL